MTAIRHHEGNGRGPGEGLLRGLGRAARLRCPACGHGDPLRGWFSLRDRCPGCGRALDRGEEDHFLGAMLLNLVVAELSAAGLILLALAVTWPAPPWDTVTGLGVLAAAGLPCAFYPYSRLIWLALDRAFRPGGDR